MTSIEIVKFCRDHENDRITELQNNGAFILKTIAYESRKKLRMYDVGDNEVGVNFTTAKQDTHCNSCGARVKKDGPIAFENRGDGKATRPLCHECGQARKRQLSLGATA